jgi:hypothetical protein
MFEIKLIDSWVWLCTAVFLVLICCGIGNTYWNFRNWQLFRAERACNPGMVYQVDGNGNIVCIGGKGETWIP